MNENETFFEQVKRESETATRLLIETADLKSGSLLVVGCSTSEICGKQIGKYSSPEIASAVVEGILPVLNQHGIFLAAQCCEHLNRALVVTEQAVKLFNLERVCVVPKPKAGGSFATRVWESFDAPCAVESVRADAGMDIGLTLIGMHLRRVAVPVRLPIQTVGYAPLVCARTRPPYIGGPRAYYGQD